MKETSPKTRPTVHPACRNFVAVVEELLARRQHELQAGASRPAWLDADWGPRNWTRTEMEDMVYGSYKQMRQGRITRPPRRETVMEIADYLNCTLEERNRLLVAADATPVAPYLTGPELESVAQIVSRLAQNLAMPAMVINRDWRIHYFNEHLIRLYGVTPEQLAALSPDQFNVLHLLFDPRLPLYPRLIQNRASWARMARQTVYGFKSANVLYQFEPWYQDLLARLMTLPEFDGRHPRFLISRSPSRLAPSPAHLHRLFPIRLSANRRLPPCRRRKRERLRRNWRAVPQPAVALRTFCPLRVSYNEDNPLTSKDETR
jgi:PAS domain-containing protein